MFNRAVTAHRIEKDARMGIRPFEARHNTGDLGRMFQIVFGS